MKRYNSYIDFMRFFAVTVTTCQNDLFCQNPLTRRLDRVFARMSKLQSVAVIIVLAPEDRKVFQAQIEKQVRYQSVPVALLKYATAESKVKWAKDTIEGRVSKVFVFDGKSYYARDHIEAKLLGHTAYDTECDFKKKQPEKKMREILRTEYEFFQKAHNL